MSASLRFAVVGSGPAGFYAVESLLRQLGNAQIDLIERLPAPYGLVRYGVAPDHPKLKSVSRVFESIAQDPRVRFIGNAALGRDFGLNILRKHYRAVIIACGAPEGKNPAIPGQDLPGVHRAADFVAWYNSHPDHQHHHFDLSCRQVAIIGHGNVALDVARILLKPVEHLRKTDISRQALDQLALSQVRDVHLIGRRGPLDAKFTSKELREFEQLDDCATVVHQDDLKRSAHDLSLIAKQPEKRLLMSSFASLAESNKLAQRRCHFHFRKTPISLNQESLGNGLRLELEPTAARNTREQTSTQPDRESMHCGMAIFSIGFRGVALSTLPCDPITGLVNNRQGRVTSDGKPLAGLYVTGWIKRGATGIIGSNRADSVETVNALLSDLPTLPEPTRQDDFLTWLTTRGTRVVSFDQWLNLAQIEASNGLTRQCAAVKFTSVHDMLARID